MKFKFIYTFLFLSLILIVSSASKNGRATVGWGNTGAPGDQLTNGGQPWTCQTCHNSAAIQVTQTFELTDDAGNDVFATGYTPGETYNAKLTVNAAVGTPVLYGFQILCLNAGQDMNGPEASNWTPVSNNVAVRAAANTNRTYVEHATASASNEFTMTWVAPSAGSGEVTFYVVSNGTNDNNATSGDGATSGKFSLTEDGTSSAKHLKLSVAMNLFPNPVASQLSVNINTDDSGMYDWSVIDVQGRTIQNGQFDLSQGETIQSVNLSEVAAGLYQFQLRKEGETISQTIVKK